jgi:hypothetical protein
MCTRTPQGISDPRSSIAARAIQRRVRGFSDRKRVSMMRSQREAKSLASMPVFNDDEVRSTLAKLLDCVCIKLLIKQTYCICTLMPDEANSEDSAFCTKKAESGKGSVQKNSQRVPTGDESPATEPSTLTCLSHDSVPSVACSANDASLVTRKYSEGLEKRALTIYV